MKRNGEKGRICGKSAKRYYFALGARKKTIKRHKEIDLATRFVKVEDEKLPNSQDKQR